MKPKPLKVNKMKELGSRGFRLPHFFIRRSLTNPRGFVLPHFPIYRFRIETSQTPIKFAAISAEGTNLVSCFADFEFLRDGFFCIVLIYGTI